ncbi:MAG TPA: hypothetical protein DIW44_06575 [Anaerolineaceae bacterium]|nr:hypothetical protein [Anaerolineaceae bacterium]
MDESLASLELIKAEETRLKGNEGMARVLARRAAGLAIREYLKTMDFNQRGLSLNGLLKDEEIRKILPASVHEPLDRLSTRIGIDFSYPSNFDLLLDSRLVIEKLSIINGELK